ncbi:MAG: rhodanese-like domain-containing protein [Flavobacterium sp.]|nr:rhodanese-like domain-containing protein [Flavobacterium sp.]
MNLTQEQWAEQVKHDDDAVVLDVRTADEFNEVRLPRAVNIDIYKGQGFIDEVNQLDKDRKYYVYCKAGGRSQQACQLMNNLGFTNTFNLEGGITQWRGEVVED